MNKPLWIITLLVFWQGPSWGISQITSDTLKINHAILEKIQIQKLKHTGNYKKANFKFRKENGKIIRLTTFGVSSKKRIAILGLERACVCIGDSLNFVLHPLYVDQAKKQILGLRDGNHFLYKYGRYWGEAPQRFQFHNVRSRPNTDAPKVLSQDNIIVILDDRLYILSIPNPPKYFNRHNQVDSCDACIEIEEEI